MLFAVQITASAQTTLTLGGFDSTRGGEFSLAPGKSAHSLAKRHRHRLSIRHPYCLATLTTTYLDTVNVLLISSIYSEGGGIASPLSTSEQKALVGFVERGGIALLFVDEDANISTIVSNSFVSPFGIHVTGQSSSYITTVTPVGPSLPVLDGPLENIAQYQTVSDGWFDVTGSSIVLATIAGNAGGTVPELLYLTKSGLCSAYKGIAVASGDSSLLDDDFITVDDQNLVLNAIALGIPVSAVTLSPKSVKGGHSPTGNTVSLAFEAPGTGITVNLTSSDPAVASVPSSVTVPGGSSVSPAFSIVTSSVATNTKVTITATYAAGSKTANLTVTP
jgi:hypothetical protein